MRSVADAIVQHLAAAGVTTIFGVPGGGSNLDLIAAAGRARLRFVLTATETAGAIAAIAQAEISGRPGACLTTLGPGVASVVNGIACASLEMQYRPFGQPFEPHPGTLEHWLTERYSLFAARPDGRLAYGEIDHRPWRLQPAVADFSVNTMLAPLGILEPSGPPLVHFSHSIDAVAWRLQPLSIQAEPCG